MVGDVPPGMRSWKGRKDAGGRYFLA